MAELSRPRRQYKDDQRLKRKPSGRRRVKQHTALKRVNWQSPFLWSQIETAAVRAGRPWQPSSIVQKLHRIDPVTFRTLTEQLVGRWIDSDAKRKGISRWSQTVLDKVAAGNSPGGETTRTGILVRNVWKLKYIGI